MQQLRKGASRRGRLGQQRGGTFLGLVLGLIIGLAIAVVVALYITKSPAPFQQKNAPRPSEAGNVASTLPAPAASQPDESADPNKPLWSKTPAKPVGQADETPAAPVAPAAPATPPVARAAPERQSQGQPQGLARAPEAMSHPGESVDRPPGMDKPVASAKPAPKENPVADPIAEIAMADANKTSYLLQVGAFRSSDDADRQKANLAMQGFEAKVTDRDVNGVKMYRVRLGPFQKVDDMNRARDRLQSAGFDASVIRFTRQ